MNKIFFIKVDYYKHLTYCLIYLFFQFSARSWVVIYALTSPVPEKSSYLGKSYYWVTFFDYILELSIGFILTYCLTVILLQLPNKVQYYLIWMFKILVIPISTVLFLHAYIFYSLPSIWTYYSVFTTNILEVHDFFNSYYTHELLVVIILFLCIPFIISKAFQYSQKQLIKLLNISLLSIVLLFIGVGAIKKTLSSYHMHMGLQGVVGMQPILAYVEFQTDKKKLKESIENNQKHTFEYIFRKDSVNVAETYVIVIGESTSKRRMEIYGYPRETNPLLKTQDSLYLFSNVQTSNAYTIQALKRALTFAETNNDSLFYTEGSVIDFFNQAGFYTAWLSNQSSVGLSERPIILLAKASDYIYYSDLNTNNYDEVLLPQLKEVLQGKEERKVIFMHLMGSHHTYNHRYPNGMKYFDSHLVKEKSWLQESELKIYNAYDNTIRYNDSIINSIIEELKKQKGVVSMLYFSDHGEEVYDVGKRRGRPENSPYTYEVPFIFWGNNNFFYYRSDFEKKILKNQETPFNTENIPHFLQEMTDIYTNLYDSTKSVLLK